MFSKIDSCLGVGINYRSEISDDIVKNLYAIDFIEVNTERFFIDDNNSALEKIVSSLPVVLHGLSLSLGSNQPIKSDYFSNLLKALNRTNCAWFSEHVAVTNVNGLEVRSLMPVELNEESIDRIVSKNKQIMSITNKNFLLENITYYYSMPNYKLSEAEFIKKIVEQSDCGILLDVNNLYVNSINHQYDPYEFLLRIPMDRVVEVHLAGCDYMSNMLIDTHASRVKKEVIELFKHVCKMTNLNGVVIERDDRLENFYELMDEVDMVRSILKKYNHIGANK